ncbi:hypothetical protein RCL1_006538 [Eukaryota sp. TZLM3-RCL]
MAHQLYLDAQTFLDRTALAFNKCLQDSLKDPDLASSFSSLSTDLVHLKSLIDSVYTSIKSLPESQRLLWTRKTDTLLSSYNSLKGQMKKAQEDYSRRRQRMDLFAGVDSSTDIQLLVDAASEATSLQNSLDMTHHYIQSGKASLSSLIEQREWMTSIHKRLLAMKSLTQVGKGLLVSAKRKLKQDFALVVVLTVVILVLLYFVVRR